MDAKDAYIRQLENQISAMQKQIENLTELILIMRQDKFGASSEKTPKDTMDGQLSLFDEAEAFADASIPEEDKICIQCGSALKVLKQQQRGLR